MAAGRLDFRLDADGEIAIEQWLHETHPQLAAFAWQEGYSVFSVSKSQEEA